MIHRQANWQPDPLLQLWAWAVGLLSVFLVAGVVSVVVTWAGELQKRGGLFR